MKLRRTSILASRKVLTPVNSEAKLGQYFEDDFLTSKDSHLPHSRQTYKLSRVRGVLVFLKFEDS